MKMQHLTRLTNRYVRAHANRTGTEPGVSFLDGRYRQRQRNRRKHRR